MLYDRTGSVFLIPEGKQLSFLDAIRDLKKFPLFLGKMDYHGLISTAEYDVPLELMRFFTGFGVRKFNYNKVKDRTGWTRTLQNGGNPTGRKLKEKLGLALTSATGMPKDIVCR